MLRMSRWWWSGLGSALWLAVVAGACAQWARAAEPRPAVSVAEAPAALQPPDAGSAPGGVAATQVLTVSPVLTQTVPISPGHGVELRGLATGATIVPGGSSPVSTSQALFALNPSAPELRFRTFDNGTPTINYTISGQPTTHANPRDVAAVPGFVAPTDNFGIRVTGYLSITQTGVYAFSTASDDGSALWLGTEHALVVDNNFFQGLTRRVGSVGIQTPGLYPFEAQFFQGGGGMGFDVGVTPPGQPADVLIGDPTAGIQVFQALAPPADPTVSLAAAPNPVIAGSLLTYTVGLSNANLVAAQGVTVTTATPPGTSFVAAATSGSPSPACLTPATGTMGTVSCTTPSLAQGVTDTLGVTVRVDPSLASGSTISATAAVTSTSVDNNPLNNTALATTTVATLADLRLTSAAAPSPVVAGNTLTYTLSLTNDGPSDAQAVNLSDPLPAGTTFLAVDQRGPTFACAAPAIGAGGSLTCTRASLGASASTTFTLTVRVDPGGSPGALITNTANVTSTTPDLNTVNNQSTTVSGGASQADLALSLVGSPAQVVPGSTITYALTVSNAGPSDAQGVTVVDPLPGSVTFLAATVAGGGSCTAPPVGGSGTVNCPISGTIPAGGTRGVTITAQLAAGLPAGTNLTNAASVLSATADPNPANNSASTSTLVAAPAPTATGTAVATATASVTPTATATPVPLTGGNLRFIDPVRVLDTRSGVGFDAGGAPITPGLISAGRTVRYRVGGQSFDVSPSGTRLSRAAVIPGDATGLLLNVTLVQDAPSGGFVTVYPGDAATAPNASTVNPATAVAANFTLVSLPSSGPAAGTVAVTSVGADRHLLLDVVGYYSPSNPGPGAAGTTGPVRFITPLRVLDTRAGSTIGYAPDGSVVAPAPLVPGRLNRFGLAGRTFAGTTLPADATGIIAHVTTVQAQASGGFTTLLPGDWAPAAGRSAPEVSTVNPSTAIAFNGWAVGLPADGTFGLFTTNAGQDVLVDVLGYYAPANSNSAGALNLVTPVRVLDTRASSGGPIGVQIGGSPVVAGALAPGSLSRYLLAGQTFGGLTLPADVKGVVLNVTVVQASPGGGFVTVFPGDAATPPNASTVNPATTIAASFWATGLPVAPAANAGSFGVASVGGPRDVIVDLVGYYR